VQVTAKGHTSYVTVVATDPRTLTGINIASTAGSRVAIGAKSTLSTTPVPTTADFDPANTDWTITSGAENGVISATRGATTEFTASKAGFVTIQATNAGKTKTYTIRVYDGSVVDVTGVTLDTTTLNLELNASNGTLDTSAYMRKLIATVNPSNATVKTVTWSSSDTNVASVAPDGTVTAMGNGTATITATTAGYDINGDKLTATCTVNVTTRIQPTPAPEEAGGGGCNTGWGTMMLLAVIPAIARRKR
ncbi:MAG: Ig-like domain-containing protein, partial [Synergistaceae bacterium]|nr:Ig-like domain-containing protein [Synergistaceae bacterium]